MNQIRYTERLDTLCHKDLASVGGKNASLGEMIQNLKQEGVRVPGGFATTVAAYRHFLTTNELEERLGDHLAKLDGSDKALEKTGKEVRRMIREKEFPEPIAEAIRKAYREMCEEEGGDDVAVAVRSSATAEDLPDASFAGQQETFLNVTGEEELLEACRNCYASLFTNRAIAYRETHGFDHLEVALSVGVQKMVRSDLAGAGVMFSLDTESGFPDVVLISAAWGLGENVVQGSVMPDEYRVFKPLLEKPDLVPVIQKRIGSKEQTMIYGEKGQATTKNIDTKPEDQRRFVLSDEEILQLARWAAVIEKHYQKPMDMEWAKDGESGELFIVQARPETVESQKKPTSLKTFSLKEQGEILVTGPAIGEAIASGEVVLLDNPDEGGRFENGQILVTSRTDPDWLPVMKRASAIVTDQGGRTSHAAIVSRELGLPAIVGAGDATEKLKEGSEVTVSCAEGEDGKVYQGRLAFEEQEIDLADLQDPPVPIMINVASPGAALRWWRLPVKGIGLARMEFIINQAIKVHPLALTRFDKVEDKEVRQQIEKLTMAYDQKSEYFVDQLARGLATIAASQYPSPAIVRTSDFKTNEYADLIGGAQFEPKEENPMLGFRGAARYDSEAYRDGFRLECQAIKRAREIIGLDNIVVMIPFVRTTGEADRVLQVMADNGLVRGEKGLKIFMMCEVPSNVILAEEFARRFDGFSIGSNDLTQLILGVGRDCRELREVFDERDPAVKKAIADVIHRASEVGCKVGICGQAPSDYPEFARFLVEAGIDSISLNPDCVIDTIRQLTDSSH